MRRLSPDFVMLAASARMRYFIHKRTWQFTNASISSTNGIAHHFLIAPSGIRMVDLLSWLFSVRLDSTKSVFSPERRSDQSQRSGEVIDEN